MPPTACCGRILTGDNQKIDTALEETAILAGSCYTRLLDETLAAPLPTLGH